MKPAHVVRLRWGGENLPAGDQVQTAPIALRRHDSVKANQPAVIRARSLFCLLERHE